MVSDPLLATLRGVCRADAVAMEALVGELADAVVLEARMQLRDRRIWAGQKNRAPRRNSLKRLIQEVSAAASGPEQSRLLAQLSVRLIKNRARHYLTRRPAAPNP
jgi:hypothetical protein